MSETILREKLPAILASYPAIKLVYLFGSQATGQAGPLSDYDLAVLADPVNDQLAFQAGLAHEFSLALGTDRVDVIILPRVPITLAYQVIAQGKLLYQYDLATRVEFEAQVLSMYGDYLPVLRAQRQDLLSGGNDVEGIQRSRAAFERTERTLKALRNPAK